MKTYNLRITGKVQGVWYRASAKDHALELGLKGRVWNNPDKSVGITVQGEEETIKRFIAWCRKGPQLARVDAVEVTEVVESKLYTGFEIVKSGERSQ